MQGKKRKYEINEQSPNSRDGNCSYKGLMPTVNFNILSKDIPPSIQVKQMMYKEGLMLQQQSRNTMYTSDQPYDTA